MDVVNMAVNTVVFGSIYFVDCRGFSPALKGDYFFFFGFYSHQELNISNFYCFNINIIINKQY
ncbi:hypothetical protein MuYL_0375 [Mucilaginibacter xinganensis]|uniref:Uncharacterized protein n=1 Tax=Mucilaginibacter xinganensis TaxID=1234841 RepID=A0A223NRJ8_9SPHI|nr:hypothetical protein MuYL_0375 [Mucilaginibacter xinganensis]